MNRPTVKISVVDGVAYVNQAPAGVLVEVTDYDVAEDTPDRDRFGRPYSRYTVAAGDIEKWGKEEWTAAGWTPGELRELGPGCLQLSEPDAALAHLARLAKEAAA